MAELTFIILYCVCAVIEAILMCVNHKFYGDVEIAKYNITTFGVLVYLIVFLALWVGIFYFYKVTKKRKGRKGGTKCIVSPKMNYVFFLWILIYLAYTIKTGVGIVGSNQTSPYSFIFSMFDINVIFPFYYVLFREEKDYRKIFIANVALYCLLRLIQGWTGFIVNIFMYELYFYCKRHHSRKSLLKGVFIVSAILLGGAYFYKIMYPLKMSIRYNYQFSMKLSLPYEDALSKLTSRFSTFCRGTYALFNISEIKKWYVAEHKILLEIQDILRSILPRRIMPDKEFMGLTSCIFASVCKNRVLDSSSSPGIIPYSVMLFYCDPFSALIWLIMYITYFLIMRKIYSMLETKSTNQMDILYFATILSMTSTGSLNVIFSQQAMKLIFIVPLLYVFGILKFRRLNAKEKLEQISNIYTKNGKRKNRISYKGIKII